MSPSPVSLGGVQGTAHHPAAEPHPLQTSRLPAGPQHQHSKAHHHAPGCREPAWARVQTLGGGWAWRGTVSLSPPGIAGWAHRCPVMITGSELGPGSSPGHAGEEGEGSHPAAGVMSCFFSRVSSTWLPAPKGRAPCQEFPRLCPTEQAETWFAVNYSGGNRSRGKCERVTTGWR